MKKVGIILVVVLLLGTLTACSKEKEEDKKTTKATGSGTVIDYVEKSRIAKDKQNVDSIYSMINICLASPEFMQSNSWQSINNITFGQFVNLPGVKEELSSMYSGSIDEEFESNTFAGKKWSDVAISCDSQYKITLFLDANEGYEDLYFPENK